MMTREQIIDAIQCALRMDRVENIEELGVALQFLECGCGVEVIRADLAHVVIEIDHKTFSTFEHDPSRRNDLRVHVPLTTPPQPARPPIIPGVKYYYSKYELLDLCRLAVVPESKWGNRDTPSAQEQVGKLRGLLLKGEKSFTVIHSFDRCSTDANTVWVECDGETFYLPTQARIDRAAGGDWY